MKFTSWRVLALFVTGLLASTLARADDLWILKQDADVMAQGFGKDGYIDQGIRGEILDALKVIRSSYPEISGIHPRHAGEMDTLEIWLIDEGVRQVKEGAHCPSSTSLFSEAASAGLPAFDRLNAGFAAQVVSIDNWACRTIEIKFKQPMDLDVLGPIYESVSGVESAGMKRLMGDGDFIASFHAGGKWNFVFSHGGGDCPAGCTERSNYYFAYDPQNRQASRIVNGLVEPSGYCEFRLWGVGDRPNVCAFDTYRDLARRTKDPKWWIAEHAVGALGYLLTEPMHPMFGEDEKHAGHFQRMRDAAIAHKNEGLSLLIDALGYPNHYVINWSYHYLKEISKQDLGSGKESQRRWRQWLERQ